MIDFDKICQIAGFVSTIVSILGYLKNNKIYKISGVIFLTLFSKVIIEYVGANLNSTYVMLLFLSIVGLVLNLLPFCFNRENFMELINETDDGKYIILSFLGIFMCIIHFCINPNSLVRNINDYTQDLNSMKISLNTFKYMLSNIQVSLYLILQALQFSFILMSCIASWCVYSYYTEGQFKNIGIKIYRFRHWICFFGFLFESSLLIRLINWMISMF